MLRGGGAQQSDVIAEAALELLAELEGSRLEVVLIPAPEPRHSMHMIRCAQMQNARWYRSLCASHSSTRRRRSLKHDTRIRRAHTVKALERIARGDREGTYAERLLPYVRERAEEKRAGTRAAQFFAPGELEEILTSHAAAQLRRF